ncbi:unknown [Clostridium sp. CAG:1024]|nr:unknown [Clostridium sp. CAG:1024]
MISSTPTEISVGRSIGNTTEKNVRTGPQPSMAAASSISSGSDLTNPVNMKMARPAPKPRYTIGMVQGVLSFSVSAVFASVNMTIWNGTTMENTQR